MYGFAELRLMSRRKSEAVPGLERLAHPHHRILKNPPKFILKRMGSSFPFTEVG
jgi:hypothetical protein